jgi:uncharacterized protein (TIGR02271 family)
MNMQHHLVPGADVYGADGQKVGTMNTWGDSYIVVEKGFFFPKDYYIPVSAITDSSDEAVYLSVTKDEALHQDWDRAPAATTTGNQVDTRDRYAGTPPDQTSTTEDSLTVPVHEEHLEASRHMANAGDVRVDKRVVTNQETIEAPVTEERVRVDWRAPSGGMTNEGATFEEDSIEIPVSREEVGISKRTVQTGAVQVTKERQQHTQKVTDSVRSEKVDVDGQTVEPPRGSKTKRK